MDMRRAAALLFAAATACGGGLGELADPSGPPEVGAAATEVPADPLVAIHAGEQMRFEVLPEAALGSRVAWVLLAGEAVVGGVAVGPGTLLYPEALLGQGSPRRADALAVAVDDVRVLAIRGDDFAELAGEDADLAEPMYAALARLVAPPA